MGKEYIQAHDFHFSVYYQGRGVPDMRVLKDKGQDYDQWRRIQAGQPSSSEGEDEGEDDS